MFLALVSSFNLVDVVVVDRVESAALTLFVLLDIERRLLVTDSGESDFRMGCFFVSCSID